MASTVRFVAPSGAARDLVVATGTPVAFVERLVQRAFDSGALRLRRSDGTLVDSTGCWQGDVGGCMRVEPVTLPSALHRRLMACPSVDHILKSTSPVRFHPHIVLKIRPLLRALRSIVVIGVQDALHISVRPVDCIFCDAKSQDPAFDTAARRILHSFDAYQTFPVLVTATTPQLSCLFLHPLAHGDSGQN